MLHCRRVSLWKLWHSFAPPPSTVIEAFKQICAQNPRRKHARDQIANATSLAHRALAYILQITIEARPLIYIVTRFKFDRWQFGRLYLKSVEICRDRVPTVNYVNSQIRVERFPRISLLSHSRPLMNEVLNFNMTVSYNVQNYSNIKLLHYAYLWYIINSQMMIYIRMNGIYIKIML